MKIAIIGSRTFSDYELVKKTILENVALEEIKAMVSGGAKGADTTGEKFADEYNIQKIIFKPDWKRFGRAAGMIRNRDIVENADYIFAFWDGKSKGTKNSINLCESQNKKLLVTKF